MNNSKFNWKQYLENYPDLLTAGINTPQKAVSHWNNYGIHEGRTFAKLNIITEFNSKQYLSNYPDLIASGINTHEKALNHFVNYGKNENRVFTPVTQVTQENNSLGFIILRHVNNERTNNLWIECYSCIRKFYMNNPILIIDDNSNYKYITEIPLTNTTIINSEFKGRGELLPYIYYINNKIADYVVILHDSVFIQEYIDFKQENKFLWYFNNNIIEDEKLEMFLINKLDNNKMLLDVYSKKKWYGCFGCMSVISHSFLVVLNNKYNLSNLIRHVTNRHTRMCLERVMGMLLFIELKNETNFSIFQNIHSFCKWGIRYEEYKNNSIKKNKVVKVWTGR
jgi:hypothetical protein